MDKNIVIASDHGGFLLKEKIKNFLLAKGYIVKDAGTNSIEPCDYPKFGFLAAKEVSKKKGARGIVICKSGIGMSIVANKMPGVRAALCHTVEDARSSREHNDVNVLALSSNKLSFKKANGIICVWLDTAFLGDRHARRVQAIKAMEKKIFNKC
ncbi:RpiB/LacA/LacB family sugar-phosphate isomerase [Candidatus Omnitrophus magneticus]|uniref:RpiB/LacA/LacB family sugar-phosphate isomerase n=1 Tax=Candidatus Omnitrophus magneticus TaxID=1609969 RepID=A0A0F0CKK0_9BACT|nr:RpiB/LacA/LacB family sugar-phosphate isomerase [Candidatus Omnitrophus magneticus]